MPDQTVSISNKTKGTPPRVPFVRLKHAILGTDYDLSIALVGEHRSRALNKRFRGKDKPANVLAFPLGKHEGELILTPEYIKREAPRFNCSYRIFFLRLVIHGLLHLKGYQHGSRMEKQERELCQQFLS